MDTPVFGFQDELFLRAIELGCEPGRDGINWLCTCPHNEHGVVKGCRVITGPSLDRAKAAL